MLELINVSKKFGVILQGAIPAALLALIVQGIFGLIERRMVPKGLQTAG